jgi:signal-transduction protein with cAMP-binding, CBS, and nucleotidyltransferase domain
VGDQGRLVAIITRADLRERKDRERGRRLTVGEVAVRNLVTARPAESLSTAVQRMGRLGLRQLPVVDADLPALPLGMLRRSDILAAYDQQQEESPAAVSSRASIPDEAEEDEGGRRRTNNGRRYRQPWG